MLQLGGGDEEGISPRPGSYNLGFWKIILSIWNGGGVARIHLALDNGWYLRGSIHPLFVR